MAYNPYKEIKQVYDAKVAYGNATTDEERKRQNEIATAARKKLESYDYGDIANKISANGADANAVKKVLDEWEKKSDSVTGTFKSGVDNPAYNQSMATASNMNTKMFDTATSDHSNVNSKYNDIFGYANSDVTQTDEYKSAFKNIMPAYNLNALQGRDNAVANGAASNGGNIDSFSAANAMRQQMAITAQGQQLAHQMGVDAYKSRVDKARAILNDLGVYNQGIYSTMDKAVSNEAAIGQAYFDNEQTSKNNETARLSEQAAVTGYVPNEWAIKGDDVYKTFLNTDGSFKSEYNNTDIQALINQAKASGDTETAQKLAVVRARKILSDYENFGKYANEGDVSFMPHQRTADYDLTNKQIQSAENIAKGEIEGSKYAVDSQERMNSASIAAEERINNANIQASKDVTSTQSNNSGKFTNEQIKEVDKVVKKVNDTYREHESNPNQIDLIGPAVHGAYSFDAGAVYHWRWHIIPVIANSGLSADEQYLLYAQLGLSGEDVAEVYEKSAHIKK